MPMSKKSTLFKLENDFEKESGALEGWEVKMEDSNVIKKGKMESRSPSDETIAAILAFAKSYSCLKSRSLDGIDLYLN